MNEDDLHYLITRLLEVGVPSTAIAKAFSMDPFVVRGMMADLRVQKYGAAEMAEALAVLQWDALAEAKAMIHDAPYNVRTKFISGILSKSMSLTARQSPETMGNLRSDFLDLLGEMTGGDDDLAGEDTSAFVALDPTNEDQDEGSVG